MVFRNATYSLPAGIVVGLLATASFWMDSHSLSLDLSEAFSLRMSCFVGCCIAAFILCYGAPAFRAAAFPLVFLFFMVPIPDSILDRMIWLLQSGSTDAAALLLKAAHIAVVRHGFVLTLPSFDIEVARECSGIRSTITLLVVAVVLSHLFIRSNWKRSLLVLLVFPIAIVRNGLRIFSISALGTSVDPSFLSGNLHRYGGIPLFVLSLGVLMLIIWWLRKFELEARSRGGTDKSGPGPNPGFVNAGT